MHQFVSGNKKLMTLKEKKELRKQKKKEAEVETTFKEKRQQIQNMTKLLKKQEKKKEILVFETRRDIKERLKIPSSINTMELSLVTGIEVDKLLILVQNLAEELHHEI